MSTPTDGAKNYWVMIDGNALEILLSGLKLQATAPTTIAVIGADLDFRINGTSQPIWQTHHIKADDILSFEKKRSGMRAYLAVMVALMYPSTKRVTAPHSKNIKVKS